MAIFKVDDYDIHNSYKDFNLLSFEVSTDENFNFIIDSTYRNKNIKNGWYTPLIKDGKRYDDTTKLYIRCKIHVENRYANYESKWYVKVINDTFTKREKLVYNGKLMGEISRTENGFEYIW